MRNALVYVLLFATLLPTVSPWGTLAYYQVNKDYIARVLCQNRDRPQLRCEGKCFLAKRLKAQQDRQDKETTERVQNTPVCQLFCDDCPDFLFAESIPACHQPRLFAYRLATYSTPLSSIFQPPATGC